MLIGGIQRFSLIDYPDKISCIVYTRGCNFRCPYCHNPELVDPALFKPLHLPQAFFNFLKSRRGKIDAVVISGGEPTLQPDLEQFAETVKALGFLIKLDTNGTHPEVLERLLARGLLDYIAMDIKAPFEHYATVAGIPVTEALVEALRASLRLIMDSSPDYEFRTTVVQGLLTREQILAIGELLAPARRYILQKFVATKLLAPLPQAAPYPDETLQTMADELRRRRVQSAVR